MMSPRFTLAIRFACVVALAFAALARQADAAPLVLTFAHGVVTTDPRHLGALQFARRVEERTNGQVKIEVFPNRVIGSDNELLEKVRLGSIDMDVASLNYFIKYEKTFAIAAMPYVFDSDEHARRVLNGPAMRWFAALAEKQGFVVLSIWEGGFRNLTNSKRPIDKPEDVRGLTLRVLPALALEVTMEALGAQVSKISFSELYPALAKGVVDGQENPISAIYSNKLYEVQKHLALTRHVYATTLHVVSAKTWVSLTPAQQGILREESQAVGDAMRKTNHKQEEALIARMVDAGMMVTRPDPRPFRIATEPARRKIALFVGDENARKFLRMVEDERNP